VGKSWVLTQRGKRKKTKGDRVAGVAIMGRKNMSTGGKKIHKVRKKTSEKRGAEGKKEEIEDQNTDLRFQGKRIGAKKIGGRKEGR